MWQNKLECLNREYLRGKKYHCTVDLLFDWLRLVCFANKNKKCQLSYSESQTSQTGGLWYSDTSPFSIPWFDHRGIFDIQHNDNFQNNIIFYLLFLCSAWPDSSIFCQFGYFLKLVVIFWKEEIVTQNGDILDYFLLQLFLCIHLNVQFRNTFSQVFLIFQKWFAVDM